MNTRYFYVNDLIFTSASFQIRRSREPHQKGGWHRSRRNWRGLRRRRVVPHRPRRRLKGSSYPRTINILIYLMSVNIIRNLVASPFFFDFSIQTSSRQSLTTTPSSGQTRTWPSSPTGTSFAFSGMINSKPALFPLFKYVFRLKNCSHSLWLRAILDTVIAATVYIFIYDTKNKLQTKKNLAPTCNLQRSGKGKRCAFLRGTIPDTNIWRRPLWPHWMLISLLVYFE